MRTLSFLLPALLLAGLAHGGGRVAQSPEAAAAKFKSAAAFATRRQALVSDARKALLDPKVDRKTGVAAMVIMMNETTARVGSEKYALRKTQEVKVRVGKKEVTRIEEPSVGISSLRPENVKVVGDTVSLKFKGKSHKVWERDVKDENLAKAVKLFLDQPGTSRVFSVMKGDKEQKITERAVRGVFAKYGATPKELRTVQANEQLEIELRRLPKPTSEDEAEANLTAAIKRVAKVMNHSPSVCRNSYLDPLRLAAYTRDFE